MQLTRTGYALGLAVAVGVLGCGDEKEPTKQPNRKAAPTPGEPEQKAEIPGPPDFRGVWIDREHIRFDGRVVAAAADAITDQVPVIEALDSARKGSGGATHMAVLVAPDASAQAVLAVLATAGDAWSVHLGLWESGEPAFTCVTAPAVGPPATPDEPVVLSTLIQGDVVWLGLSRVNDFRRLDDVAGVTETVDEFGGMRFFADRKDAQIAAEPGVDARRLFGVLDPLCARFPELEAMTPEALTAKPLL